jgi:hypothetical protein
MSFSTNTPPTIQRCLEVTEKFRVQPIEGEAARYAFGSFGKYYAEVDEGTFAKNSVGDTYCGAWTDSSPF